MNDPTPAVSPALLPDERLDRVNEQLLLIQKKNGLTFGTDAFLLAAFLRPAPHAFAVELGSGTGIIPLLLAAKSKVKTVVAVEVQPAFAELIERNVQLNGFSDRIRPLCADLRQVSAATLGKEADTVLANPPYMRCDSGKRNLYDEKFIARHEVCGGIEDFCAAAARLLKHGGKFLTVWRPDRLSDLFDAQRRFGLEPKRMTFVHADGESEPCMVLTEAIKGGAPAMRISAPLLLYEPRPPHDVKRQLTPKAQQIYDTCSFSDFYPQSK